MRTPSYRRHSSGQARVTIQDKTYYLGPYNTKQSRQEYDRLISEYLASGRSSTFGQPVDDLTVSELMADYLRFAKKNYGESELAVIKLAMRPLRSLYGTCIAKEFGPLQYKAVREHFVSTRDPKWNRQRTRQGVNALMKRVARLFKWSVGEGKLPASVYEAIRLVPGLRAGKCEAPESKPILPVDESTIEATLKHLPSTVADMVKVQRLTGMRPGELLNLTPGMVDRSDDIWQADLKHHKNAHRGKSRIICFGPLVQPILAPYLLRGENECCFQPSDSERKRIAKRHSERVTPPNHGNNIGTNRKRKPRKLNDRYDVCAYRRAIHRAAIKVGVPTWHPNQLRHSAGTSIRREFGIEASQAILGHSSLTATQVYSEKSLELAKEIARKIG